MHDGTLYRLTWLAAAMSLGHHLDHLIRGNAVGWPVTDQVNAFTFSLVVYPVIATGQAAAAVAVVLRSSTVQPPPWKNSVTSSPPSGLGRYQREGMPLAGGRGFASLGFSWGGWRLWWYRWRLLRVPVGLPARCPDRGEVSGGRLGLTLGRCGWLLACRSGPWRAGSWHQAGRRASAA
jgi:hypothetical protein